jgi:glycosyltransferase involved in cell wall biosynthesis
MRVGILSPTAPAKIGGGYTLEHEIFERVLEVAPASKHQLVIFEGFRESTTKTRPSGFKTVPLKRPLGGHLDVRGRTFVWEHRWVDTILEREKIEFLLNTTFETVTVNTPFLAVVWDLQHRLQPFFPEVSLNGEWLRREEFYSQVLRRAAFVVVGTQAGKSEVQTFYGVPEDRIRLLPHPTPAFALDETVTNSDLLTKYNLPRDYVFYPAQFWSHKNHIAILQALHHLNEKENLRLPVVFTGSDRGNEQYVRSMANKLQLNDQIFFLGHVSRETLQALYRNALALCYVSFFGPENLPPLEAFGLGCPVIAANVPGASEQLGDAAILISPVDEIEIAQALKLLHNDRSTREDFIRRGKERARRFTGRDFAKGLFALLDEFESIRRCWSAPG